MGSAPNSARMVSVRPLPTRPATPTISPCRTANDTAGVRALRCKPFDPQQFAVDDDVVAKRVFVANAAADHHPDDVGDRQPASGRVSTT